MKRYSHNSLLARIDRFCYVHGPALSIWLTLAWMLAITALVGHLEGHY